MICKQKILITGIEGFSGFHLEKTLLNEGYEVYGTCLMPSSNPHYLTCDITKIGDIQAVIDKVLPDAVIHLAGISFVGESNTALFYDVNVIGTKNLLDALLKAQCPLQKVILASSATVYGNQHKEVLDESMCPHPINHYGISKLAMEYMASTYFEKLPIIIVRPFNYTGIGQGEHFLIPKIVKHYREKQKCIELGNLEVAREFNDARDIVDWYIALLKSEAKGTVVNLCSGKAISLLEVIDDMNVLAGYTIEVKINPAFVREHEIKTLFGSTQKLHQLIVVNETHSIQKTLEWMYEN